MNLKSLMFNASPPILRKMHLGYRLFFDERSILLQSGYIDSKVNRSPIDADGNPLPWMCYPLIDFLKERLNSEMNVFEFGSGSSTLFFAKRVKTIHSVEHDKEWYAVSSKIIEKASNAKLSLVHELQNYPNSIHRLNPSKKYHLVIIDGRMRNECLKASLDQLSENGVILFDDSFRTKYQEGIEYCSDQGFKKLRFRGLKPTGLGMDESTLLYRSKNCFGI